MHKININSTEKSKYISIQQDRLSNDIEICTVSLCKVTNGRIYIFMNDSVYCLGKDSIASLPAGYKISKMDLSFDFSADIILFSNSLVRQVISKRKLNVADGSCIEHNNKDDGGINVEGIEHMHTYFNLFKDMALNCRYNAAMDGLAFGLLYLTISNKNNQTINFSTTTDIKCQWRVHEILQTNPTFRWKISDVAKELHTSESTLRNSLAKEGVTFRELLNETKLEHAYELINSSQVSIKEIVKLFGYTCASQFSAKFKRKYGFSPKDLRK